MMMSLVVFYMMSLLCHIVTIMQDDEVSVEKYISPEMKKKMDEAEKLEEQKQLAEMVKRYHNMYSTCVQTVLDVDAYSRCRLVLLLAALCSPNRVTSPERGHWT